LSALIGQEATIASLQIAAAAARQEAEPLGHVLLSGPPGLGKSTIGRALAAELGTGFHATSGPLLRQALAPVRLLAGLRPRDVLFIDEIHALPQPVAETLYEALAESRLSLLFCIAGQMRCVPLRIAPFTLVGATSEDGLLPQPLVSRFEHREHLSFYRRRELTLLIEQAAAAMGIAIDPKAACDLASVSRRTPREALRLLRRVRERMLVSGASRIDRRLVRRTLQQLRIDARGLGPLDRRYLRILRSRGPGRPLGIQRVAAMLGVAARTLERFHEPYLFHLDLATITPQGRVALRGVGPRGS
jgi:Holliday junction DNA helicase RuvB